MKKNLQAKDIDRLLRETPAPEFENEEHQRVLRAQLLEQYSPAEADETESKTRRRESWARRWGLPPIGAMATLLVAAIGVIAYLKMPEGALRPESPAVQRDTSALQTRISGYVANEKSAVGEGDAGDEVEQALRSLEESQTPKAPPPTSEKFYLSFSDSAPIAETDALGEQKTPERFTVIRSLGADGQPMQVVEFDQAPQQSMATGPLKGARNADAISAGTWFEAEKDGNADTGDFSSMIQHEITGGLAPARDNTDDYFISDARNGKKISEDLGTEDAPAVQNGPMKIQSKNGADTDSDGMKAEGTIGFGDMAQSERAAGTIIAEKPSAPRTMGDFAVKNERPSDEKPALGFLAEAETEPPQAEETRRNRNWNMPSTESATQDRADYSERQNAGDNLQAVDAKLKQNVESALELGEAEIAEQQDNVVTELEAVITDKQIQAGETAVDGSTIAPTLEAVGRPGSAKSIGITTGIETENDLSTREKALKAQLANLLTMADQAAKDRDYDESIALIKQYIELTDDPVKKADTAKFLLTIADQAAKFGDYHNAIASIRQYIELIDDPVKKAETAKLMSEYEKRYQEEIDIYSRTKENTDVVLSHRMPWFFIAAIGILLLFGAALVISIVFIIRRKSHE
ncbi:hypothetical protein JXA32_17600 [Candidatus Sumerlaeota bacterium]|nr:hypothetical protein [Candidatus Sumerlaeota bacterium]